MNWMSVRSIDAARLWSRYMESDEATGGTKGHASRRAWGEGMPLFACCCCAVASSSVPGASAAGSPCASCTCIGCPCPCPCTIIIGIGCPCSNCACSGSANVATPNPPNNSDVAASTGTLPTTLSTNSAATTSGAPGWNHESQSTYCPRTCMSPLLARFTSPATRTSLSVPSGSVAWRKGLPSSGKEVLSWKALTSSTWCRPE
mmetsp:Transcript_48138/g.145386  ORF Transcript_48138/g.145386 Transcript_48138/m.145386 type:complete len:203 (+) Transcript_48138:446-1054(+)